MAQQDGTRNANVVLTADTSGYNRAMDESAKSTNAVLSAVTTLTTGINHLSQQAGRGFQIIGTGTLAGLTAATVSAGKLEAQMTSLHSSAIMSGRSLGQVDKQVNELRGGFSLTTESAVALVTQLNKLGQGGAGVRQIATEFVKLGAVTGESIGGLVDGMVTLQRQMGTEGPEYTRKFASSLATLSERAGVSAQGVLQFSNAIAPIGKVAGMTQTEIMGVSTAFAKSGEDGYRAANAFNSMLTDITRSIQYGSPHLQEYSNLLGVSVDQFKKMPKTEAVTEIFEKISKQGPDAIKTLERFGLDGIRTYRSLQAVASTGGLRKALADATEGYENNNKFNQASKEALSGLNDEMQKLGNNTTRVVQAFGQGLLPVFTMVARAINAVVSPLASLLEQMGKVPGLAVAAGGAVTVLAGTVLKSATGLSTAALGAQILRGTGAAGFRTAAGFTSPWTERAAASRATGAGSFTQRAMYDTGALLGRPIGMLRAGGGEGGGGGMGLRERASRLAGGGIRGVGRFVAEGFNPLFYRNLQDPFHRSPLFTSQGIPGGQFAQATGERIRGFAAGTGFVVRGYTGRAADAARQAGRFTVDDVRSRASGMFKSDSGPNVMGAKAASEGMADVSKEAKNAASGLAKNNTALKAMAIETGRVNLAMARASAGITATAGKLALTGLGKVGGGILGLLGGPAGAALMGGMAGIGIWQHQRGVKEGNLSTDVDTSADKAAGAAYRTALGQAAEATTTFADVVQQNASSMGPGSQGNYTGKVTPQMAAMANRVDTKYTDPQIAKMDVASATAYSKMAAVGGDKQQQMLLALDLTKRFGPDQAQKIMNEATRSRGSINLAAMHEGMGDRSGLFGNASQEAKDRSSLYGATVKQSAAEIQQRYGTQAASQFITRAAGQIISTGTQNSALQANTLAQIYGISDDDTKSKKEIEDWLQKGFINRNANPRGPLVMRFSQQASDEALSKIDSPWARQILNSRKQSGGSSFNPFGNTWAPGTAAATQQNPVFSEAEENVALRNTAVARMFLPSSGRADRAVNSVRDSWMTSAQATRPMPQYFDQHLSNTMQNALSREGDPNAQARAVNELTDKVMKLNPNMSQAVLELARFKGAAGATTSQLSQLGQAAMGRAMQLQEEQNFYGTSAQQAGGHQQNYQLLRQYAARHPEAPQAEEDAEKARQQVVSDQQAFYNRARSIVVGKRELDIGQSRQREDFGISRERTTAEFTRQRSRAEEDFNLQRTRSDAAVARQESRTMRDFNLSRSRALYEFNLQRTRSDQQVAIQQSRALRDFTLARSRGMFEFNLARSRQEESYNRQLKRSWRDFEISRSRAQDDYDLQRRRQDQQYGIQLQRQLADYNLQRQRSQSDFDLSRRRQEQDFQHQVVLMTEQAAKQVYNIYERVNVKRTWSAGNLLANMADQQQRLAEQTSQLAQLRKAGVSGDVIKMLGLNETDNAQQLARFLDDVMADPKVAKQFNEMATKRTEASKKIITDQDNSAWEEMVRSYELNRKRASDDFEKGMKRQAEDFNKGLKRMREDYNRSIRQADADFIRSRNRQRSDFIRGLKDQRTEYNIQVENAAQDFARQRAQQSHDFAVSINDMRNDYARQVRQANADFARQRAQQVRDLHTQLSDQRSEYQISMNNASDDFARARARQQNDFNRSMSQQVTDFNKQQRRAISDFSRSQLELSGSINSMGKRAVSSLTGNAKKQFGALFDVVRTDGGKIKGQFKSIGNDITAMFSNWGIPMPNPTKHGGAGGAQANAKHADIAANRAEGGSIPGYSPHAKADNVLIRATAGEFMHPVDAVKHYGLKTMEAIRTKQIPKEALDSLQGLASGGQVARANLVAFGHRLQRMGYQVSENPSFGGVTPGAHVRRPGFISWHYRDGAIDVNHDQGGEMAALDRIMPLAKQYGLGIHWRTANHFDHAHFDIGGYSALGNNRLVPNSAIGSLGNGGIGLPDDILKKIKSFTGIKQWEALRKSRGYLQGIPKDYIAKQLADTFFSNSAGAGDMPGPQATPSGSAQRYARSQLGKYGWGAGQFDPLQNLWNRESNWRWNARNPSSGAYGIPQSLPGNKMASAGSDWMTNPATQIDWGLEYIKNRYGSPSGAWAHSQRTGWYGDGAVFNSPRQIGVGDRGPEAVLPLNQKGADFMHALLSRYNDNGAAKANLSSRSIPSQSKNITYYSRVDQSTNFTGDIKVVSNDPREMARKLDEQKRMKALIGRKP